MRRLITSLLVFAAFVSCSKDSGAEPSGSGDVGGSATTTTANINISTKSETDATSGIEFEDGSAIGIRIEDTKEEGNVHTHDDNAHIKVVYSAAVEGDAETETETEASNAAWTFYTGTSYNNELRQISLEYIVGDDNTGATVDCNVYAYSPFNTAVTDFEAVPFTLTNMYDYMWAKCPNFSLTQTNEEDVKLNFQHILSRFRFKMQIKNEQSGVKLYNIAVYPKGDAKLVTGGTFNAKTGESVAKSWKTTDYLTFDFEDVSFVCNEEYIRDMYLYPMTVDSDTDFEIKFRLNSPTEADDLMLMESIYIPKGNYVAGKSYTFNITFDNYAKIELESVIEEAWENPAEEVFEI